jgi:hypothetical protein
VTSEDIGLNVAAASFLCLHLANDPAPCVLQVIQKGLKLIGPAWLGRGFHRHGAANKALPLWGGGPLRSNCPTGTTSRQIRRFRNGPCRHRRIVRHQSAPRNNNTNTYPNNSKGFHCPFKLKLFLLGWGRANPMPTPKFELSLSSFESRMTSSDRILPSSTIVETPMCATGVM